MEQESRKWYDNKIITLVLTVIFFPVGLYALWKGNSFGKTGKIVVTVIVGLVVLAIMGKQDESTSTKIEATASIQRPTENEVPKQTSKPQGISREIYDTIEVGMSKTDVLKMLGEPSTKSQSHIQGMGTMEMFQWQTTGFTNIKAISIMFHNGEVSTKNWIEM